MNEPHVTLPVEEGGTFDVIVVGGGLAGCAAAIASARNGAKTLLIEAMPYIGGNGTSGIPLATFRAADSEQCVVGGIPLEIAKRLEVRGALGRDLGASDFIPVDPECLQITLTHMLDEAGVELQTYATLVKAEVEEGAIKSAVFCAKGVFLRYSARMFVDASGDAQLANLAGLETPMGRARDGKTQPMTLVFTLGGVSEEGRMGWKEVQKTWEELRESGSNWRNPRSGPALSGTPPVPGKPGLFNFNVTRVLVDKGTDPRQLTLAEKEGRYQIEEFVEGFLRPHIPGYEKCYLTQIFSRIGIRETRRIVGEYILQSEDLVAMTRFDDAIACNSYPVDIHSPDGGDTKYDTHSLSKGGYYTIPYRSLVAKDVKNLLACGRCVSASHEALAAIRILAAAMATGEAAGTAAALSLKKAVSARDLDWSELRTQLKIQGAIVD